MKTLIVYSSQTSNTKKLADALYENMAGDKEIFNVGDAPDPEGYDLVAVGFWFQAGKPDPKSSQYLSRMTEDHRVFLFATHGAGAGSDHVRQGLAHAKGLINGAQVAGAFTCQGEVSPQVLEKARQKETPPVWIKDADQAAGHPDASDINALVSMVRQL